MIAIERGDLAGCAGQQLFETARAHAEQGVMGKTQFRFRDEFEIHQLFERGIMRGADIGDFDLTGLDGVGQRHGFDRIAVEKTFDDPARFRIAGTAVVRLEFEAIEDGWIVAGGDHHAADGALRLDRERN